MRDRTLRSGWTPQGWTVLSLLVLLCAMVGGGFVPLMAQDEAQDPVPSASPAESVEPVDEVPAPEAPAPPEVSPAPEPRVDWDEEEDRPRLVRRDTQFVVGSDVVVERNERVRDVAVLGGDLDVLGEVDGDALAIGGYVRIEGTVDGDVVALGDDVELGAEARVRGDVTSVGGRVEVDPDARVDGQISEVPIGSGLHLGFGRGLGSWWDSDWTGWRGGWHWNPFSGLFDFFWETVKLGILILLGCLVLVLMPRIVERVGMTAAADPLKSGLVGLATQVLSVPFLIVLVLVLVVSIIGIPLLILVPFLVLGLVLVAFVGYVAGA